ncbi:hypothetical protein LAZ67_5002921 [Cordylochernes scorpioides]|uniref:Integrase catalytic domain-containing protein n=1 Tax=Cordylochernes scorpioides TaxID=51811 RepID=A0ABY6KLL8_9ARAC|nr:hypothetical protein LAZ67_5002921 [Cordylochernes scorpioides]
MDSIKAPEYWPNDPELGFITFVSQFFLKKPSPITNNDTNYSYLISLLPLSAAIEFQMYTAEHITGEEINPVLGLIFQIERARQINPYHLEYLGVAYSSGRFDAGIIDSTTQNKFLQEETLTFDGAVDIALSAESADNELRNIKGSENVHRSPQYLHAIDNICKHCEVRECIMSPPPDNKYDPLKKAIIKCTADSEFKKKLQQLVTQEELGDRLPSQLLRRLRQLVGESKAVSDTTLKMLWMQRLPSNIQIILTTEEQESLNSLADLADRVTELTSAPFSSTSTLERELASLRAGISALKIDHNKKEEHRWKPHCQQNASLVDCEDSIRSRVEVMDKVRPRLTRAISPKPWSLGERLSVAKTKPAFIENIPQSFHDSSILPPMSDSDGETTPKTKFVISLSTEYFLMALEKFIKRRGRPSTIFSDNGTNFVGANYFFKQIDWKRVSNEEKVKRIEWKFTPPTAAWWGGWWERLIRSLKDILKRMLGTSTLTYQQLMNLLCHAEAVINGRPVTYVSDDSNDLVTISPSMFLQEQTDVEFPECQIMGSNQTTQKLRYLNNMREELKSRFRKNYLSLLVQRNRRIYNPKLQAGDVVFVALAQQMKDLGEPISDVALITKIICSLPDKYKNFITAWDSVSSEEKTLENLTARLLKEESLQDHWDSSGNFKPDNALMTFSKFNRNSTASNKQQQHQQSIKDKKKNTHSETSAFLAETKDSWIADSGATDHMTSRREWFSTFEEIPEGVHPVCLEDGKKIYAKGKGNIDILSYVDSQKINATLLDVLYIPELETNLFSISTATKHGLTLICKGNQIKLTKNSKVLVTGIKENSNLYRIFIKAKQSSQTHVAQLSLDIWHQRMGHVNPVELTQMFENNVFEEDIKIRENPDSLLCEACIYGKQNRKVFHASTSPNSTYPGELIYSDVCGPMSKRSPGGSLYFVSFKDDFSRFRVAYFIRHKSDVLEKFKEFVKRVRTETGNKIKRFRTDNGTEFLNKNFSDYLKSLGIVHELTAPYTPEQNGISERDNRTIVESARCLLHGRKMPLELRAEAVNTAVYLLNRCTTKVLGNSTPYEIWYKRKPSILHLKTFGCNAYVHIPKDNRKKLDKKKESCRYPLRNRIREMEQTSTSCTRAISYACYVHDQEPLNYEDAIEGQNSKQWKLAMDDEFNSLMKNQTWTYVTLPSDRKAIACKWARLVAKGYSQKPGLDYGETFSPVVKFDSIRTILSLCALLDMEMIQLDVKSAFLNGDLEEELYMEQPQGYENPDFPNHDDQEIEEMNKIPYRQTIGSLMYLMTGTRPDIAYAVSRVSQFMNNPGPSHWTAVMKIFGYLKATKNISICFGGSSCTTTLIGFSDADFAGDLDTRKSNTGYVFMLNNGPISWCSQKHKIDLLYVCSNDQAADIFTKALPPERYRILRSQLGLFETTECTLGGSVGKSNVAHWLFPWQRPLPARHHVT